MFISWESGWWKTANKKPISGKIPAEQKGTIILMMSFYYILTVVKKPIFTLQDGTAIFK